ncbi:hypothetical protein EYV94_25050 [Puteibacter caeruleilacunae]|nr:hypothetical protein EYV94_25050 [Puteibacter caeruleilacunae]
MIEILKILQKYENGLNENQLYPKIEIYSDGSGELIDGHSNVIIAFDKIKKLENFLKDNQ